MAEDSPKKFSLFRAPSRFGSAGIRRQRISGSLTYLGTATALQRGCELSETGISVSSFVVRYFPRVDEYLESNTGERVGRVVSTVASREITVEGEVTGSSGVMAFTFLTAVSLTNDIADFGSPSGGVYMKEATVTQSRADWRKVSIRLESDSGLS